MIEVKLPRDIVNFKPKHILNLTLREFICAVIGLFFMMYFYIGGRYIYKWDMSTTSPTTYLIFTLGFIIIFVGFFNWHNLTLEQAILQAIKFFFLTPRKRYYHNNNDLMEVIENAETKEQRDYIKAQARQNSHSKKGTKYATLPEDVV